MGGRRPSAADFRQDVTNAKNRTPRTGATGGEGGPRPCGLSTLRSGSSPNAAAYELPVCGPHLQILWLPGAGQVDAPRGRTAARADYGGGVGSPARPNHRWNLSCALHCRVHSSKTTRQHRLRAEPCSPVCPSSLRAARAAQPSRSESRMDRVQLQPHCDSARWDQACLSTGRQGRLRVKGRANR